jgi:membrane associated rhomboid family serine protease
VAIFVVLFFMGIISPQKAATFEGLFALTPSLFLKQPWTIFTSMFLHAGWWHIFGNMFTLYFFGSFLARLIGERRLLYVYFIGGLMGSVLYILLGSPNIPAVGASGAIFALAGALTILAPRLKVFIFPLPVPIPLWVAVIGGFLLLSFMPMVAWQAHLGGLLVGLAAGLFFRRKIRYYIR